MRKLLLIIILFICFSNICAQNIIIKKDHNSDLPSTITFDCSEKELNIPYSILKIARIDENCMKLELFRADGYTGENVLIIFDQNLKVWDIEYNEWSDAIDLSLSQFYKVEDFKVIMNTNPFNNSKLELKGSLKLNINKMDFEIDEKGIEHFIQNEFYRTYSADYKCKK